MSSFYVQDGFNVFKGFERFLPGWVLGTWDGAQSVDVLSIDETEDLIEYWYVLELPADLTQKLWSLCESDPDSCVAEFPLLGSWMREEADSRNNLITPLIGFWAGVSCDGRRVSAEAGVGFRSADLGRPIRDLPSSFVSIPPLQGYTSPINAKDIQYWILREGFGSIPWFKDVNAETAKLRAY